MAVYGATKAFVLSFTEALWSETRKDGTPCTCGLSPAPPIPHSLKSPVNLQQSEKMRSVHQLLDNTLRILKTTKPSFVDGVGNAIVARFVTRVVPKRFVMTIVDRALQQRSSQ